MDHDERFPAPAPEQSVHIEEVSASAIEIQTRTAPQGIPLHSLLAAVQKEVPSVNGMHLSGDTLLVSHPGPPSDDDRERIARVLGDAALLNAARSESAILPESIGIMDALKNSDTPDDEWLRLFRQYAVKFLLEKEP